MFPVHGGNRESALNDLVAFRFSDAVKQQLIDPALFVQFDREAILIGRHRLMTAVTYGYLTERPVLRLIDTDDGFVRLTDGFFPQSPIQFDYIGQTFETDQLW